MSQAELLESLNAAARKHLDPALPMPLRLMAAKGLVPLPPRDMVLVLCGLVQDADASLQDVATKTLQTLPDKISHAALSAEMPPSAWGVLADCWAQHEDRLEKVIVNRQTPDAALARLAPTVSARLVEILAENQERCLRCADLVRGLVANPHILRSSLDRVFDFLLRAGVIYDDMPLYADAMARLSPSDLQAAADKVVLPAQALTLLGDLEAPTVVLEISEITGLDEEAASDAVPSEEAPPTDPARVPMLKLINSLNAAQKVALAMKGNKEARSILLRDANRMVATAAVRNPRLTEQEVVAAAKSRSINDEVIRIICNSREMTRSYQVRLALIQNPKTPAPTALRFLGNLRQNDLRGLAKSKSVPGAVAVAARKLLSSKNAGG